MILKFQKAPWQIEEKRSRPVGKDTVSTTGKYTRLIPRAHTKRNVLQSGTTSLKSLGPPLQARLTTG
jgi:hypothetical protein